MFDELKLLLYERGRFSPHKKLMKWQERLVESSLYDTTEHFKGSKSFYMINYSLKS